MSLKLVLHNNYSITDKSVSEDNFGQFPKVVFVVDVNSFFYFFGMGTTFLFILFIVKEITKGSG